MMVNPMWTFLPGYFISTAKTPDCGWETMVFPAEPGAGVIRGFHAGLIYGEYVHGVDFDTELMTRHYRTRKEAVEGHRQVVAEIEEMIP